MARDTNPVEWGSRTHRDPGPAAMNPAGELVAAVAGRAIIDLRKGDVLAQVDALAWFIADDGPGALFLAGLGYPDDQEQIFRSLLDGA